MAVLNRFGMQIGGPGYHVRADINADGDTDITQDAVAVLNRFGSKLPVMAVGAGLGFETGLPGEILPFGLPAQFGLWSGDFSRNETGAAFGISPFEGDQVLQFLGAAPNANSGPGEASQVHQLVDLGNLSPHIETGTIGLSVSAWFNRIEGSIDTRFDIILGA